jgi:hypothetical protein
MNEGIKRLLDEVLIGDESLYSLTEPLISKCEELSNGDSKKFTKCLREAYFAGLYITENLQLPPGLRAKPQPQPTPQPIPTTAVATASINKYQFEFIRMKV